MRSGSNSSTGGRRAFSNVEIVPLGQGILHQINLERFSPVVITEPREGGWWAYPDTLVGTDSHTTMINALGVLGWGVGGIEAKAVMLGRPIFLRLPEVVGVKLTGKPAAGILATDIVLALTERFCAEGVVAAIVELHGEGVTALSLGDRATSSNMSPEFGSTASLFPIDDNTIDYLQLTGRTPEQRTLVEAYAKATGLWADTLARAKYDRTIEVDLGKITRAIAGLLARKASERGLKAAPWVKTSLAPESRSVLKYLESADLYEPLQALGFDVVGYGCTTCSGMSGPLAQDVEDAIRSKKLTAAAVLSGNRNFEGRIHPLVRDAFLASPPLVVAYAIAGSVKIDIEHEAIGRDDSGRAVFLRDLWPSDADIDEALRDHVQPRHFTGDFEIVLEMVPAGSDERETPPRFGWREESTYIRRPPYWSATVNVEGHVTKLQPEDKPVNLFDAAQTYLERGQPLGLDGTETYDVKGAEQGLSPRCTLTLEITRKDRTRASVPSPAASTPTRRSPTSRRADCFP